MLNHARTLLLNLAGNSVAPANTPGEEPIPSSFLSQTLPTYLSALHRQLFGAIPDRWMLNYRGQQLFNMLLATELHQFCEQLDARFTYAKPPPDFLSPSLYLPQVVSTNPASVLVVSGAPQAPDAVGRMQRSWTVTLLDSNTASVRDVTFPNQTQYDFTVTSGLSSAIPLGAGYVAALNGDPADLWAVSALLQPQRSLGEIAANLATLGEDVFIQLFGTALVEPYLTFSNLWRYNPELPYKLGGLLLAMIYRLDALWSGHGS